MVISILNIIGGAVVIVAGIATVILGNGAAEEVAMPMVIAGFIVILLGVFEIIGGIIGVRAAVNPRKSGLFYAISVISLLFSIASIIAVFITTGFHIATLFAIIMPLLMFFCARTIREQGRTLKEQDRAAKVQERVANEQEGIDGGQERVTGEQEDSLNE